MKFRSKHSTKFRSRDFKSSISFPLWLLFTMLVVALFCCVFLYDNTLIRKDNSTFDYEDNHLYLSNKSALEEPIALTHWVFYPNCKTYEEYLERHDGVLVNIFDLQYDGLEKDGISMGAYVLTIHNASSAKNMVFNLYIPAINSASWVFVGGEYMIGAGDVGDHYQEYAINQQITISVEDQKEIVIFAENEQYFRGGLINPPLIAKSGHIVGISNVRMMITLGVMLYSLFLCAVGFWVFGASKDKIYLWFGIMCITFAVAVSDGLFMDVGTSLIWAKEIILKSAWAMWGMYLVMACTTLISRNKVSLVAQYCAIALNAILLILICLVSPFTSRLNDAIQMYNYIVMVCNIVYLCIFAGINFAKTGKNFMILVASTTGLVGLVFQYCIYEKYLPMYTMSPYRFSCFFMLVLISVKAAEQAVLISKRNLQFNANLVQEVEKRTKKIESLLQERKEFTSMVAHDLKAPLASIKMMLSYRNASHQDIDAMDKMINNIDLKIMAMTDNLTTLQNFNAIDMKNEEYQIVEVGELLKGICDFIEMDANAEGIELKFKQQKRKMYIKAPVNKFTRAMENIIFNAISFCQENDKITVSYTRKINVVEITVSDTGCGISPRALPHIFDKFYTDRSNSSAVFKSDGLGLYFVKILIEEMGGSVYANSWLQVGTDIKMDIPEVEGPEV